jgi:pimeloyl-ACP methyl ester carboxylesterase
MAARSLSLSMAFPAESDSFYASPHGKIHYRSLSLDGAPPICILPGFTMPSSLYVPIAQFLHGQGFSVSILDYWGRGFSDPRSDNNYSLDAHIALIPLFLNHLQVPRSSFIGFSYGAAVLAGLSSKHPELVLKVAFISPLHFTFRTPSSLQRLTLGLPYAGPLLLRVTAPQMVRAQVGQQIVDRDANAELIDAVAGLCLKQFQGTWAGVDALSRAIGAFQPAHVDQAFAALANVNKRMIVMIGDQDAIVNPGECRAWWQRWFPNANLIVLEGCGHLLFLEKKDEVGTELRNFFAS